jgi:hypothetical protein
MDNDDAVHWVSGNKWKFIINKDCLPTAWLSLVTDWNQYVLFVRCSSKVIYLVISTPRVLPISSGSASTPEHNRILLLNVYRPSLKMAWNVGPPSSLIHKSQLPKTIDLLMYRCKRFQFVCLCPPLYNWGSYDTINIKLFIEFANNGRFGTVLSRELIITQVILLNFRVCPTAHSQDAVLHLQDATSHWHTRSLRRFLLQWNEIRYGGDNSCKIYFVSRSRVSWKW